MTRIVGNRIRCVYQLPHDYRCDRPAVGEAWNPYVPGYLPICLPCVDRIGIPLNPYTREHVGMVAGGRYFQARSNT